MSMMRDAVLRTPTAGLSAAEGSTARRSRATGSVDERQEEHAGDEGLAEGQRPVAARPAPFDLLVFHSTAGAT